MVVLGWWLYGGDVGVVVNCCLVTEGELEKKKPNTTKSEKRQVKKPSFEAAVAIIDKQRISNLFYYCQYIYLFIFNFFYFFL
ncbi:hypothetical protein Hanom_Chr04g00349991 [Helianthus anomalus]